MSNPLLFKHIFDEVFTNHQYANKLQKGAAIKLLATHLNVGAGTVRYWLQGKSSRLPTKKKYLVGIISYYIHQFQTLEEKQLWIRTLLASLSRSEWFEDIYAELVKRNFIPLEHKYISFAGEFVGRKKELSKVTELLKHHQIVNIIGLSGVGKTRLANEIINTKSVINTFSDCIHQITAQDQDITAVLNQIALKFGVSSIHELQGYFQKANHKSLVLINQFTHLVGHHKTILDLCEQAPNLSLLITSQKSMGAVNEKQYLLKGLSYPPEFIDQLSLTDIKAYDSVKYFCLIQKQVIPDFKLTTNNVSDIALICQTVLGYPLAIRLLASMGAVPSKLLDLIPSIYEIQLPPDIDNSEYIGKTLQDIFSDVWLYLSSTEQDVILHLSIFTQPFSYQAACALVPNFSQIAPQLVTKGLLDSDSLGDRYSFQTILQSFTSSKVNLAKNFEELHTAHVKFYLQQLNLLSPGNTTDSENKKRITNLLKQDYQNLVKAWLLATKQNLFFDLHNCSLALLNFCDRYKYYSSGLTLFKTSLDSMTKDTAPNNFQSSMQACLAWLYVRIGEFSNAKKLAKQSLDKADQNNIEAITTSHNALAACYDQNGNFTAADTALGNILKVTNSNSNITATTLGNRAINARKLGQFEHALRYINQAEEIFIENQHNHMLSWTAHCRGFIYLDFNKPLKSFSNFHQAFELATNEHSPHWKLMSMLGLAKASLRLNKPESCRNWCETAQFELGNSYKPSIEFELLYILASLALVVEEPNKAAEHLYCAFSLNTKNKLRHLQALLLQCDILIHLEQYSTAYNLHMFCKIHLLNLPHIEQKYWGELEEKLRHLEIHETDNFKEWEELSVHEVISLVKALD